MQAKCPCRDDYQQALDFGQDGLLGCIVEQREWDVGERMGAFPSGRTPQGLVAVPSAVAASGVVGR